jgi:protein O-mannosyl-transferase
MPTATTPACPPRNWRRFAAEAVLIAAGLAVYSNSLEVPFLLDDWTRIENNAALRTLWPVWVPMSNTNRPFGCYTLAINYALHGYRVSGYHAVNLAIHLAAGLLLFGIIRRTLAESARTEAYRSASEPLALAIALVWIVHPLETQAVTYVVQRLESLMSLCYLATLYAFIRAQTSRRPGWWYAGAVACSALGMGTKEVMATAPLMVLWYDRVFVADSWRAIVTRRRLFYLPLAGTWAVLAWAMLHWQWDYASGDLGDVAGVTPLAYLLSQAGVLMHYFRLCFWPRGQCFDYAWPVAHSAREIVPPLLAIGAVFAATLWCSVRRPAWGYLGGWFFVVLAPTSSIVPVRDLAVEHRMYLASAAVFAAAILAAFTGLEALGHRARLGAREVAVGRLCLAGGVVLVLGVLTFQRNATYAGGVSIWQDTVDKAPANARARCNLGDALCKGGQFELAIPVFLEALRLQPNFAVAEHNLGIACYKVGRFDDSTAHLIKAIELRLNYDQAYHNLGSFLCERGLYLDGVRYLATAIELEPRSGKYQNSYGTALYALGEHEKAIKHLQLAVRIIPKDASVHYNLANALLAARQFDAAIVQYQTTLAIDADYSMAPFVHTGLGAAFEALGEPELAVGEYREAVALKPDQASARYSLAQVLNQQGRRDEAIAEYRKVLAIEPGHRAASRSLRLALEGVRPPARRAMQ